MTVNSYLSRLATSAIVRDSEKESIARSTTALKARLHRGFGSEISGDFVFGSYSRGTILPRHMDSNSDIDYMIVFRDDGSRPQTYLDRLRRFVRKYYGRSEIFQSNPTIVLSLNHIKIELVPGLRNFLFGYRIPAKSSDYEDWVSTNPTSFNQGLIDANRANHNLVKPVVRLAKYWNARNGHVYDSFELEETIANGSYFAIGPLFGIPTIQDYFFDVFEDQLRLGWGAAQWRREKLARAQRLVSEAKRLQSRGEEAQAERVIHRLLPPVSLLTAALRGT